jgi:hypothetical protein
MVNCTGNFDLEESYNYRRCLSMSNSVAVLALSGLFFAGMALENTVGIWKTQ